MILDCMTTRHPKSKRGFTLIELLVVIAIIAILAAILFPVFARVREKARQITCLSNQKQIGYAITQYIQDFDETFPYSLNTANPGNNQQWTQLIQPYIKLGNDPNGWSNSGGVYSCPSHPHSTTSGQFVLRHDVFPDAWNGGASGPVITLSRIDAPSDKVALWEVGVNPAYTDGSYFNNTSFGPTDEGRWVSTVNPGGQQYALQSEQGWGDCDRSTFGWGGEWDGCLTFPRYRHNNTSDFLFLDGHVKAIPRGRLDYAKNLFIPNVCENATWNTCSVTPY